MPKARRRWAELLRRIFEVDPLVCPQCGGAMRVIAFVTAPDVIAAILTHLRARAVAAGHRPRSPPSPRAKAPARSRSRTAPPAPPSP